MSTNGARFTAGWISIALAALAAGCAQMTEAQCRSANWYQVGLRDGDVYGLRPQIDQYAHQCRAFGIAAEEPTYMAGWVDGYREYLIRMNGSECCGTR